MSDCDATYSEDNESFVEWLNHHRKQITIDLMAGTASGIANCISAQPMDTVKVRIQISTFSFKEIVIDTYKNEGILAFYKGMSFPILSVPLINASVFTTYEFWKRFFREPDESQLRYWKTLLCGMFAGSVTALISSPVELAKIRLQAQHTQILKNPFQIIRTKEGFKGPYRGHFATQQREIAGYGGQFLTYEVSKDIFQKKLNLDQSSNSVILISGGLAGMACWFFSYPQDTIKTILQLQTTTEKNQHLYKHHKYIPDGGFFDCCKQILSKHGLNGLWRGLTGTLFRAFYANAVGFYTYEISKSLIRNSGYIN